MGVVNLGGGSYQDYQAWTQTAAGKQSAANHQAKYGDQSQSKMPVVWQPPQNWQQQLSQERSKQPGPPVIGNAPNGRPVTGAITKATPSPQSAPSAPDMTAYAPQGGFEAYRPSQAQPKTTSQGTPYWQPMTRYDAEMTPEAQAYSVKWAAANQPPMPQRPSQGTPYDDARNGMVPGQPRQPPPQPTSAMPQFDYEGMMRQYQDQVRQYYQQAMPQFTQQPAAQMSAPQVASYAQPSQQPAMPRAAPKPIPFTFTIPPAVTSPADLPPEQRPPGFTHAFTDPFGNQTQNNPMAQRDALIQRINEQSLPYYMGRTGQFNPNLQELWGQAGNMVRSGWTNPLTGLFG